MATKEDLVAALGEGKRNARTGTDLEEELGMPKGNTNEPTRGLIAESILNDKIPIGSNTSGYFLIDSDSELEEVVSSLQNRIRGVEARISSLQTGWERRKASKAAGSNWPK